MALTSPSPTTEAFAAARRDLAAYKPSTGTLPAIGFSPLRRPAPRTVVTSPEPRGDGPLLRASRDLRSGSLTVVGLLERSLSAISAYDTDTGAVVSLLKESAAMQARQLDAEIASGHWRGPLHGIPITVKDNIDVAGAPTRAGSAAYHHVAERDAPAVERLREAGVVVVAKVATHEFALGVTTPQARHPLDSSRIPGGSSGGSAISIATGMALGSIGTDTRASIRVPAALCGVTGFKPTYGYIPADGTVWLSWTMDHVGVLATTVADAAYLVSAASPEQADLPQGTQVDVRGWRVGVSEAGFAGASSEVECSVRAAIEQLRIAGVEIVSTESPSDDDFRLANAAGLIISRAEALSYHRSLGTDFSELWPETADQFRMADSIAAGEYLDAQRFRQDLARRMVVFMTDHSLDALAMPTTLVTAPLVSQAERFFTLLSRNAIPWSLLGWPSASVPCEVPTGSLPVGLQLVAPPHEDASVCTLGMLLERA